MARFEATSVRTLGAMAVVTAVVVAMTGLVGCSSDDSTTSSPAGATGSSTSSVPATMPAADVPDPTVTGPITGGTTGIPFSSMPAGMAEQYGYAEEEFFLAGSARSFVPDGELGADGRWTVTPSGTTAPFQTRMLVRRPTDPAKFNGTVVVEWLNVSGGLEADPDFGLGHEELLRSGYAYAVVSAQAVGVIGGAGLLPVPNFEPLPLVKVDPERYGTLVHPGDDFSYDMFAQAAEALRHPTGLDPLAGLVRRRILAVGESQSAFRMTTFANAIQPITHVFDGFLIHSRSSGGDPLNVAAKANPAAVAVIRSDLDVPVMQVETETDLFTLGFYPARQPDTDKVRTWEIAGASHADQAVLDYGIESGKRSVPGASFDLAAACGPINAGPMSVVLRKAFDALNSWVKDGTPPATAEPILVEGGKISRDLHGNAVGGLRTPVVDVPTASLTGEGNSKPGIFCSIFGSTTPFDAATLSALYPTHADYVTKVTAAAQAAVTAGHLLEADGDQIVADAEQAPIPA